MPIDTLIINSPYEEPTKFWDYLREERRFVLKDGRRSAGYIIASPKADTFDDPGIFVEIPLVNQIRTRVRAWREADYPGATGITKRLLRHWTDPDERGGSGERDRHVKRFFFCQIEAIETVIFLTEAPDHLKTGIDITGDGGDFTRWCSKMATGSGKTIVMAMMIAWQVLNRVSDGRNGSFSKHVLIVAPGLTVKSRLSVLNPSDPNNYYDEFDIVPHGMRDWLRQGQIKVINWHTLAWDTEERIAKRKSVDKRGSKSDKAYIHEILGEMKHAKNLIVINDEAHHAWRISPESKVKGVSKAEIEESTIWVGGLDRIHRACGILQCFDLSATPFAPTGKKASEETLFPWIVSDFGLNDAIESGLVKTPRVVIRDDGIVDKQLRSRLYHIYMDDTVKHDIARSQVEETQPLPDLIKNAYILLGKDWLETKKKWEEAGQTIPPVMITVANNTATSSRIKYSFDHDAFLLKIAGLEELCHPDKTLQIDSKVLEKAETEESVDDSVDASDDDEAPTERKLTKKQQGELLRKTVDTVGRMGQPGEQIQNVISVGMLSEGWDAKTVTHIMGLRAFSSQLLCEQVVGRGLRRTSYEIGENGLFAPEYVNIFGIPFTFLPHEGGDGPPPPPPSPKTRIEPVKEKAQYEITFPNVVRIDRVYRPQLSLDWNNVNTLTLNPYDSITEAELAPLLSGKPNPHALSEIEIRQLAEKFRLQTLVFKMASTIYHSEKRPVWKGAKETFLIQLIEIIEKFVTSNKLLIQDPLFNKDEIRRRILIMLNIGKVIQHIWNEIRTENTEVWVPVFDKEKPIRATADVRTWWTSKSCSNFKRSHINFTIHDSLLEYQEATVIDKSKVVKSFVKNDHIGFVIHYSYQGVIRKYVPDYLIQRNDGTMLVLETKGRETEQDKTKRAFLEDWCKAINQDGRFGTWIARVSYDANDLSATLNEGA